MYLQNLCILQNLRVFKESLCIYRFSLRIHRLCCVFAESLCSLSVFTDSLCIHRLCCVFAESLCILSVFTDSLCVFTDFAPHVLTVCVYFTGYLYSCPTKTISGVVYNQFKCSMNDGNTADWSTGHCTPIIFRKDNGSDCPDDSDERELQSFDLDYEVKMTILFCAVLLGHLISARQNSKVQHQKILFKKILLPSPVPQRLSSIA